MLLKNRLIYYTSLFRTERERCHALCPPRFGSTNWRASVHLHLSSRGFRYAVSERPKLTAIMARCRAAIYCHRDVGAQDGLALRTRSNIACAAMASVRPYFRPVPRPRPAIPSPPERPGAIKFDLPTFDPLVAAQVAKLRYVSDRVPGIARLRVGEKFVYRDPQGRPVRDMAALARFNALRIPPAWSDVWICPDPNGHIQAVGRDSRGRKQYVYHPRWREVRDETKFAHMLTFGNALPRIRRQVERDIRRRGLPREKILAAVVRLMERTLGRVGNPEYAKQNESFGLTTLRRDHVRIAAASIELDFRGKRGVHHHKVVSDATLARILRACHELPGSELFKYRDEDGTLHRIYSEHVNVYLRDCSGHHITAKDFRTWAATNLAVLEMVPLREAKPTKRAAAGVVKRVAEQLGNTPAVCRKSYIHPRVLATYLDGSLRPTLAMIAASIRAPELYAVEGVVMRLLKQWTAADKLIAAALTPRQQAGARAS
jgi:DNA topoisomerase I